MSGSAKTTLHLKDGGTVDVSALSAEALSPDYIAKYTQMGRQTGGTGTMYFYLDVNNHNSEPQARVIITAEGATAIVVNESERGLAHLTPFANRRDEQQWHNAINEALAVKQQQESNPLILAQENAAFTEYKKRYLTDESLSLPNGKSFLGFLKLTPQDMTPETYARYEQMAKEHFPAGSNTELKILLYKADKNTPARTTWVKTADGSEVLVINPAEHKWTKEFMMRDVPTDEQLRLQVAAGILIKVNPASLPPDVYERYREMATDKGRMELASPPQIYLDRSSKGHGALARTTREGTQVLIIDAGDQASMPGAARGLNDAQMEGMEGHELWHLRHGDGQQRFDEMVKAHNSGNPDDLNAMLRQEEKTADLEGAGPRGSCDYVALAQVYQQENARREKLYFGLFPGKTEADYRADPRTNEPTHPAMSERIAYLNEAAAHQPVECGSDLVSPSATPAVKSTGQQAVKSPSAPSQ